jgi:hypothetical protein
MNQPLNKETKEQITDIVNQIRDRGECFVDNVNPELIPILRKVLAQFFLGCMVMIEEEGENKLYFRLLTNLRVTNERFEINSKLPIRY